MPPESIPSGLKQLRYSSERYLQILWLLLENTHLETKRSNEGKPESERAKRVSEGSGFPSTERVEKGVTQGDLNIEAGESPLPYRHRSPIEITQKVRVSRSLPSFARSSASIVSGDSELIRSLFNELEGTSKVHSN
jgi:hypothetical protein